MRCPLRGLVAQYRKTSRGFRGIKPVCALDLFHGPLDFFRYIVHACGQRKQQRRCRLRRQYILGGQNRDKERESIHPGKGQAIDPLTDKQEDHNAEEIIDRLSRKEIQNRLQKK